MKSKKFIFISIALVSLIFVTILVSLNLGSFSMNPVEVIKTLIGQGTRSHSMVIFNIRLPRIIIALLVGTALATAGTLLQGVTKNDLADSGILGINSGAA
ncbi:MAG: iron chelate uptake ABC transporter family permease subunit, partial [Clostridium baratii]|nr:iron chelate uptake ABC transporter family permease subunit [Clostridium baratii]